MNNFYNCENYDGGDCRPSNITQRPECPYNPKYIGDGKCQDFLRNPNCNYDGGDCIPECTTVSGKRPNEKCIFPFRFRGKNYNRCIDPPKGKNGTRWCSVKVYDNGKHIKGHHGFCGNNCPGVSKTKNKCNKN